MISFPNVFGKKTFTSKAKKKRPLTFLNESLLTDYIFKLTGITWNTICMKSLKIFLLDHEMWKRIMSRKHLKLNHFAGNLCGRKPYFIFNFVNCRDWVKKWEEQGKGFCRNIMEFFHFLLVPSQLYS